MAQYQSGPGVGDSILAQVAEDMNVYDRNGDKIGTVETVYLGSVGEQTEAEAEGAATTDAPGTRGDSLVDNLLDAFTADDFPEVLRERLLRRGFIRIDSSGLFSSDRYATPDQISSVSDDSVHLNVVPDKLIKR